MSRRILTIAVLAILIVIGMVTAIVQFNAKDESTKPTRHDVTLKPFSITGIDKPEYELSSANQRAISDGVKQYLSNADKNTDDVKGEVRDGSFSKKIVNGGSVSKLLVDIPSVEWTYKISLSSDADGYGGLYIVCPTPEELIYEPFNCKDDLSE